MNWSEIPKQTLLKENGEVGDCWRCCVAALVGLPAEEVPHFLKDAVDNPSSCDMDADTQEWLNQRGWYIAEVKQCHFHRWARSGFLPPAVIACGPTARSTKMGQHHAVIMRADELLYDPHPSGAGLTAIIDCHLIFPIREESKQKRGEQAPTELAVLRQQLNELSQILRAVLDGQSAPIAAGVWDTIKWDEFAPYTKGICAGGGVVITSY